jgi:hypothetical protein
VIRRIIFYIAILITVIWISGAYYIKTRLTKVLDFSNNNVELSYKDMSIGGFPFEWKIILEEPRLALVNQFTARELSTKNIELRFNYDLRSAYIVLPEALEYNFNKLNTINNYSLINENKVVFKIIFSEFLHKINLDQKLLEHIKSINTDLPKITVISGDKEIFHATESYIKFQQTYNQRFDIYKIKFVGNYKSDINYLNINTASFYIDSDYTIRNNNNFENTENFDHKLNINSLLFKLDNAVLDVRGSLNLARTSPPRGKIAVSMVQYQEVVDFLLSEDSFISSAYVKKLIAKSTLDSSNQLDSNNDDVKFDINFSDNGILVGNLNLLELDSN